MRLRHAVVGGLGAAVLLFCGCPAPKDAEVSGTVTVDGQLIESGAIRFDPVDGQTPTAGGLIKDGRYSVRVPITTMKVSISAPKVVGKKKIYADQPNSPEMPITVEALPARYNEKTELRLEVKPGVNPKDWELQGK
jgi:hypothetical protein